MTNEFKHWLHRKSGVEFPSFAWKESLNKYTPPVDVLIKAMWAINSSYREGKSFWAIQDNTYLRNVTEGFNVIYLASNREVFFLQDHNNSEQQALEKALEYFYEQAIKQIEEKE